MTQYSSDIRQLTDLKATAGSSWHGISPEHAARMRAQNRFRSGLDIARYTAKIMRQDMVAYDKDASALPHECVSPCHQSDRHGA